MNRLIIVVIATLLSFPALAETFYLAKPDPWEVTGRNEENLNAVCVIEQNWNRKTVFSLYQDMHDGELYMIITNPAWKITNPPGSVYSAGVDFPNNKNNIFNYEVLSPDSIRIRDIKKEQFLKLFVTEQTMLLKMPGNIPSLLIPLKGSRAAFSAVTECMGKYESDQAHPKVKGTSL
jgi:hypothetical protein